MEGRDAFQKVSSSFNVVGCISLKEEQSAKRSGVIDYRTLADTANVPYFEIDHINDESSIALLNELNPDILIILGWSQLLSEEVLAIPKLGTIGAHASLLPALRGSAPINWAIINGLRETGNTLMWLNPGVDTGEIIDQISFEIDDFDDCKTLYDKVAETNSTMLLNALPLINEKGKIGAPQEETDEPILPRRRPKDGLIDFTKDAWSLYNFVRALAQPYPGAFFYADGIKCIVWQASYVSSKIDAGKNGEVHAHLYATRPENCGIVVCTDGDGSFIINQVEVEGQILMAKELHDKFPVKKIVFDE